MDILLPKRNPANLPDAPKGMARVIVSTDNKLMVIDENRNALPVGNDGGATVFGQLDDAGSANLPEINIPTKNALANVQSAVSAVQTALEGEIAAVEQTVTTLQGTVSGLQTSVASSISTTNGNVATLGQSVSTLSAAVEDAQDSATAALSSASSAQSSITTFGNTLAGFGTALDTKVGFSGRKLVTSVGDLAWLPSKLGEYERWLSVKGVVGAGVNGNGGGVDETDKFQEANNSFFVQNKWQEAVMPNDPGFGLRLDKHWYIRANQGSFNWGSRIIDMQNNLTDFWGGAFIGQDGQDHFTSSNHVVHRNGLFLLPRFNESVKTDGLLFTRTGQVRFENFWVLGGRRGVTLGDHTYIKDFKGLFLLAQWEYGFWVMASTDTGERILVDGSFSEQANSRGDATALYMPAWASPTEIITSGLSGDYCDRFARIEQGTLTGFFHLENRANRELIRLSAVGGRGTTMLSMIGGNMIQGQLTGGVEPALGRPSLILIPANSGSRIRAKIDMDINAFGRGLTEVITVAKPVITGIDLSFDGQYNMQSNVSGRISEAMNGLMNGDYSFWRSSGNARNPKGGFTCAIDGAGAGNALTVVDRGNTASTADPNTIASFTLGAGGANYTNPVATISGGTGAGLAEADVLLAPTTVASVAVERAGRMYTTATVKFINVNGNGSGAAGTVTVNGDGTIGSVTVTNPGSGYTRPPAALIYGDGYGAVAKAVLTPAAVASLQVTNPGAYASGSAVPTVTISDSDGGVGSGATATAVLNVQRQLRVVHAVAATSVRQWFGKCKEPGRRHLFRCFHEVGAAGTNAGTITTKIYFLDARALAAIAKAAADSATWPDGAPAYLTGEDAGTSPASPIGAVINDLRLYRPDHIQTLATIAVGTGGLAPTQYSQQYQVPKGCEYFIVEHVWRDFVGTAYNMMNLEN